mmetsp:Transcript_54173/g.121470  ORF Transcript_54173/g.121470 Transcript_54173/m.121470 type:complete len:237 (-) Transcript_54173:640-1350(-)
MDARPNTSRPGERALGHPAPAPAHAPAPAQERTSRARRPCHASSCRPALDSRGELWRLVLEEMKCAVDCLAPGAQALGHQCDLFLLEHTRLHPCHAERLIDLIHRAPYHFQGERTHDKELHVVERKLARFCDISERDRTVSVWAYALEEGLRQTHKRDLLLEKIGVGQQCRLFLQLLVVLVDQALVLVNVPRIERPQQLGQPDVLARLQCADNRVLKELTEIVQPLPHQCSDAKVK